VGPLLFNGVRADAGEEGRLGPRRPMAPAAKRGAKGTKWNRDPQLGDLVLAKVKGYPFWPAKVSRPEDWNQEPTPRKFFVLFFGTKEIAFVGLQDLQLFTEEVKNDLVNQAREKRFPKRHAKGLEEALVEICKAYDELPKSSEIANDVLPDRTLDMSEKPTESLVKPPDDGETPRVEQMEVDCSVDNLNTLRHGSGTEENVKDAGHDRKDIVPAVINRKKPVEKDSDHPKKKKPVTSKSATNMHLEQMEVDSSVDNLNNLRHGSGTEENVKDGGHDRKDTFPTVTNRKKSVEKNSDHPKKNKPVTSKSAINMHLEQARSPTSLFSGRETEDQKVGKEGHPTEGMLLDPTVEIVCALEVPKKEKPKMQLKTADREENKHVDGTGISGRTTPEALPGTVPTNSADKESGGFKKLKPMKQSLMDKSQRRCPDKVMLDKPNKQLTVKSPVVLSSNKKSLPGSGQRKPEGSTDMRPAKRPKLVDRANETVKTGAKSELRLPADNGKDNSVKNEKSTSVGARNNTFPETVTADGRTRKSGVVVSPLPRPHSERMEQAPGSATKLTGFDTAKKGSSTREDGSRVGRPLAQPRRRACRFDDDEEEEQRTPPHKTVAKSISTHVTPTDKTHQTGIRGIPSSQVGNVSAKKSGLAREEKPRSVGRSPVKHEPIYSPSQGKVHARPQMTGRKSATISVDTSSALGNKINPADRKSNDQLKNPGSSEVKKPQGSSSKVVQQTSGNSHSQSHATLEKNVLLSKSENAKVKAKPSTQIAMTAENRLSATLSDERSGKLDHSKEDRSNFVDKADFAESNADSDKSIKRLIAAAQAKRNHLASGQGNSDGSSADNAVLASAAYGLPGRSPSPVFHIPSASRNAISEGDIMQSQDSICEPGHRVDLKKPAETDHEHEKSPKPKQSSGSLGGGTDAAIARDALEGMIETLSRTKDSIGRATRHAIECSKHGIAEEIVELLIRKIENEPNLHRKVDLLFLLDSITQCSHSQKGVAGASYVPTVQAALPRLLSAAAPPVAGARENRRQCLKVPTLILIFELLFPQTIFISVHLLCRF
uniref:PWWP domain-containing protein n=1 Tax=Aegilops tauschii subsp. strangulata TaxID=200361 RepID=A0A453S5B9_AEGTS